jgi:hypothetical protein
VTLDCLPLRKTATPNGMPRRMICSRLLQAVQAPKRSNSMLIATTWYEDIFLRIIVMYMLKETIIAHSFISSHCPSLKSKRMTTTRQSQLMTKKAPIAPTRVPSARRRKRRRRRHQRLHSINAAAKTILRFESKLLDKYWRNYLLTVLIRGMKSTKSTGCLAQCPVHRRQ